MSSVCRYGRVAVDARAKDDLRKLVGSNPGCRGGFGGSAFRCRHIGGSVERGAIITNVMLRVNTNVIVKGSDMDKSRKRLGKLLLPHHVSEGFEQICQLPLTLECAWDNFTSCAYIV